MNDIDSQKVEFGRGILGPIFYDFCRKLYLYQSAYENDAVCLFAYRGGARLLYLYEKYLKINSIVPFMPQYGFFISRILALKGAVWNAYNKAERIVLREYPDETIDNFISSLCTDTHINLPENAGSRKLESKVFYDIVFGNLPWSKEIQKYLDNQRILLGEYLASLVGYHRKILFVDTGWSGTTQYFLMKAFPKFQWEGVYFGKWDTWKENPSHYYCISGISVEGTAYDKHRPQTAIFQYHHIIESPLEPCFSSVEHLIRNKDGSISPYNPIDTKKIPPQHDELIFRGICDFFEKSNGISIAEMSEQVYDAWQRLRKKILYPTIRDVKIMTVPPRSADFGKKVLVPVISSETKASDLSFLEKLRGIQKSIWKQGKIVQEFPFLNPIVLRLYNWLVVQLNVGVSELMKKLGIPI